MHTWLQFHFFVLTVSVSTTVQSKYRLLTKHEVKMAGYWVRVMLNSSHLDQKRLNNKGFVIRHTGHYFLVQYNRQSQKGKVASACPNRRPITVFDFGSSNMLVELYNKVSQNMHASKS